MYIDTDEIDEYVGKHLDVFMKNIDPCLEIESMYVYMTILESIFVKMVDYTYEHDDPCDSFCMINSCKKLFDDHLHYRILANEITEQKKQIIQEEEDDD